MIIIRKEIADILENEQYDDGSYGPILVRLAWHAAGTYDKNTGTGKLLQYSYIENTYLMKVVLMEPLCVLHLKASMEPMQD
jgi:hypothetical protein